MVETGEKGGREGRGGEGDYLDGNVGFRAPSHNSNWYYLDFLMEYFEKKKCRCSFLSGWAR